MNTKTFVGGLIGGVAFFLLGWVIFGIAMEGIMTSHSNMSCMRDAASMNLPILGVANLLWGILFAYIFVKGGISSFSSGATQGAIISVILGLSIDLFMYSTTLVYSDLTLAGIDIVANAVLGALGGGVIGWWLGRK